MATPRPSTGAVPADVRSSIEQSCPERVFEPGETLMQLGDTDRTCFLIVHGDVLVTSMSTQGSTVVLSRRSAGHLVGELAALDGTPRSATVTARNRTETRVVSATQFAALLHEHPTWAVAMLRNLSWQLRSLTERYALLSEDLQARLVDLLITNFDETGDPAFRSSRGELAAWVGATREATTRLLKRLESDGLISLSRGMVRVEDRAALARRA